MSEDRDQKKIDNILEILPEKLATNPQASGILKYLYPFRNTELLVSMATNGFHPGNESVMTWIHSINHKTKATDSLASSNR